MSAAGTAGGAPAPGAVQRGMRAAASAAVSPEARPPAAPAATERPKVFDT